MKRARNSNEEKMEAIVPKRIEDLPAELLEKIFIYIPPKDVINLSLVSKVWASIILTRNFSRLWVSHHLSISSSPVIVISTPTPTPVPLYFTKCSSDSLLNENEPTHFDNINPPFQNPDNCDVWFIGACHGLLCVSLGTDSIVLWNPLTTKSDIFLNPFQVLRPDLSLVSHGFGFDPLGHDYIVLCYSHLYLDDNIYNTQLHFLSLNTRTWNVIPGDNYLDYYPMDQSFQFAHNSIIWYFEHPQIGFLIASFSLTTRTITQFHMPEPTPLTSNGTDGLSLGVLANNLVLLRDYNMTHAQFWMMDHFGDDNSWSLKFTIPYLLPLDHNHHPDYQPYHPLHLSPDGILLLRHGQSIVQWNPLTATLSLLEDDLPIDEICTYMESLLIP